MSVFKTTILVGLAYVIGYTQGEEEGQIKAKTSVIEAIYQLEQKRDSVQDAQDLPANSLPVPDPLNPFPDHSQIPHDPVPEESNLRVREARGWRLALLDPLHPVRVSVV